MSTPIAHADTVSQTIVQYAEDYGVSDVYTFLDILSCESNFQNVKGPINKNGTYDLGPAQINSIHIKEAQNMGLDLNDYDDNIHYALYLYKKEGTKPWLSSQKCWSKHEISGGKPSPSD